MRTQIIVTLIISVTLISGCNSGGIGVVPVTGTVTYNGSPVAEALVMFLPMEEGTHRGASAVTGAEGNFSLRTLQVSSDGAMPGKYIVLVEKTVSTGESPDGMPIQKQLLPEKYRQREATPLRAEVQQGKNEVKLELTD